MLLLKSSRWLSMLFLLYSIEAEFTDTSSLQVISLQKPGILHKNIVSEPAYASVPSKYDGSEQDLRALPAIHDALSVMQDQYFEVWQGIWSTAIDWTAAVIGTYLSSSLMTLSKSRQSANLVEGHFSQLIAFYFGQDAFALRQEAYDDMLWVVLGWLESVKFIKEHSKTYSTHEHWHGTQFIPAFAHRARLFWDFASRGWDTELCHGGMIWSPYLTPYKNAITNELFIAASVSMYLHFPGDNNSAPFLVSETQQRLNAKYLAAAIEGYKWLHNSNMTNDQGLYVDGFHISHWTEQESKRVKEDDMLCDARNEMVYTYNQGVLLTGQRGLYEATGARSYLEDGHELVRSVIAATGYNLSSDRPLPSLQTPDEEQHKLAPWYGLGRNGVVEEFCDARAECSQDAQTFKGIFFHHLTAFCLPLPGQLARGDKAESGFQKETLWHSRQCRKYGPWIKHNAQAAMRTRNEQGKFGMWWSAPGFAGNASLEVSLDDHPLPDGAVDYRNKDLPHGKSWRTHVKTSERDGVLYPLPSQDSSQTEARHLENAGKSVNDRGRGRTVETQGGGIAVLRAYWELVERS